MKLRPFHIDIIKSIIELSSVESDKFRHEINHAINTLEWLLVLLPDASESLQVSVLLHDCDRFIKEKRVVQDDFENYDDYKKAHSIKSAEIAKKILLKIHRKDIINQVTEYIADHEFGTTTLSAVVCDADSLSFFDQNIQRYYFERGAENTEKKIAFMYNKLSAKAKELLKNSHMEFKKILVISNLFLRVTNK